MTHPNPNAEPEHKDPRQVDYEVERAAHRLVIHALYKADPKTGSYVK